MCWQFRSLVLALLLVAGGSTMAWADGAREEAGRHVVKGDSLKQQAQQAKESGDSEQAARLLEESAQEYQAAYDLVPHPLMLYNLAQVYRLAGKSQKALQMYNGFLASEPAGEAGKFARRYVRILERSIERAEREKAKERDDAAKESQKDRATQATVSTAKTTAKSSKGLRYSGMAVAAAGLVSAAIGIKYAIDAQDMASCLGLNYPAGCQGVLPASALATGGWSEEAEKLENVTLPATRLKTYVFSGVGATAIVVGAVLYFVGKNRDEDAAMQSLRVAPVLQANEVGLAFSGLF